MVNIIALEGIIGCGKSTVIRRLVSNGYVAYSEPISDWSLLEDFYKDQKTYASVLQMQILCSYHKLYKTITETYSPETTVIMERGPWTSRHVFGEMHYECGNMSTEEYEFYKSSYDKLAFMPVGFIYMKMDPYQAYSRCVARNRESERNIKIDYLRELSFKYDLAMSSVGDVCTHVNSAGSEFDVYDAVVKSVGQILNYIE